MIQCCVCEDWFHREHLRLESSGKIPVDAEGELLYEDLICPGCSTTCSFVFNYPQNIFVASKKHEVVSNDEKGKGLLEEAPSTCASDGKSCEELKPCGNGDIKPANISGGEELVSVEKFEKDMTLNKCSEDNSSGSKFYNQKGVIFLLDKDNSIAEYERRAKQRREGLHNQEDASLNMFNNLGHIEKVEIMSHCRGQS